MGATASAAQERSAQRGVSWWLVALLGFVMGGVGGTAVNWRTIGSMTGLLPPTETSVLSEIRRETTIEESTFITAVAKGEAALSTVISATDTESALEGESVASHGSALSLSDDGLILLLEAPTAPKDVALLTRDGYVASVTRLGTDPWSSLVLARVDLRNVPSKELQPLALRSEPPDIGQRVALLRATDSLTVSAGVVSSRPRSGVQLRGPMGDLLTITPAPDGIGVAVDLGGSLVAVTLGERGSLSAPAIATLVSNYQRTSTIARPSFGFAATDVLPGSRTFPGQTPSFGGRVTDAENDGPFVRAGGRVGDLITTVNGRALSENIRLADALVRQLPGATVDLVLLRDGATVSTSLIAGTAK